MRSWRLLRARCNLSHVRVYISCRNGVTILNVMWFAISFIDAAVCGSVTNTDGWILVCFSCGARAFIRLLVRRTSSVTVTSGTTSVLLRVSTGSSRSNMRKLRSCRFNIVDVLFESVGNLRWVLLSFTIRTDLIPPSADLAYYTSWLVAGRLVVQTGLWRSFRRSGRLSVFRGCGLMDRCLLLLLARCRWIPCSSVGVRLIGWPLPWGATILVVHNSIISRGNRDSVSLGSPCQVSSLRGASLDLARCKLLEVCYTRLKPLYALSLSNIARWPLVVNTAITRGSATAGWLAKVLMGTVATCWVSRCEIGCLMVLRVVHFIY